MAKPENPSQVGWRIVPWCRAIGCTRSTFYNLLARDPDLIPVMKLGAAMTIILISPADYLRAKSAQAAEQDQATAKATAKALRATKAAQAAEKDQATAKAAAEALRATPRRRVSRKVAQSDPAAPSPSLAARPPDGGGE
jgi:hypothetical protein